ncbi:hypothetical protein K1719_043888 [Acacia pycnantha]|nr:hypothetical protein K1719_043888 [Acacia pycnantha]
MKEETLSLSTPRMPTPPRLVYDHGMFTSSTSLSYESLRNKEVIKTKDYYNNVSHYDHQDKNVGAGCAPVRDEMMQMLRIALLCTCRNPADRPSMRDVVMMLQEAKPKRKMFDNIVLEQCGDKDISSGGEDDDIVLPQKAKNSRHSNPKITTEADNEEFEFFPREHSDSGLLEEMVHKFLPKSKSAEVRNMKEETLSLSTPHQMPPPPQPVYQFESFQNGYGYSTGQGLPLRRDLHLMMNEAAGYSIMEDIFQHAELLHEFVARIQNA